MPENVPIPIFDVVKRLESLTGIGVYQGPNFIKHSYFDRFDTQTLTGSAGNTVTRHAGGISFKRSNAYPTMTSCYMQNITFGYCDGVGGCGVTCSLYVVRLSCL